MTISNNDRSDFNLLVDKRRSFSLNRRILALHDFLKSLIELYFLVFSYCAFFSFSQRMISIYHMWGRTYMMQSFNMPGL